MAAKRSKKKNLTADSPSAGKTGRPARRDVASVGQNILAAAKDEAKARVLALHERARRTRSEADAMAEPMLVLAFLGWLVAARAVMATRRLGNGNGKGV